MIFYEDQIHLGTSFSFTSNQNLLGLAHISSWSLHESPCQVGGQMMKWGGSLEHSLGKRWPIGSVGAKKGWMPSTFATSMNGEVSLPTSDKPIKP